MGETGFCLKDATERSVERAAAGGSRIAFFSSSVVGVAVTLLQLYNAITLKTFWPFFTAIATLLLLAMPQFILLVAAGEDKAHSLNSLRA